jgi:RNA polymerase sigma-70 factor (ECF subfamily)
MTDKEKQLIEQCKKGDRKSQLQLYEQLFGLLMGLARRYYRNREDCKAHVNTAFLKILDGLKNYTGSGSFEGYCRRIMTNTLIDEWRKQKNYRNMMTEQIENPEDIEEEVFNEADQRFAENDAQEMLLELPDATRHVFNLFALEGYSHREIAQTIGISEGTSRWHVNDARRILKNLIIKKLEKQ